MNKIKKPKKRKVCLNLLERDYELLKTFSNKNCSSLSREITVMLREKREHLKKEVQK